MQRDSKEEAYTLWCLHPSRTSRMGETRGPRLEPHMVHAGGARAPESMKAVFQCCQHLQASREVSQHAEGHGDHGHFYGSTWQRSEGTGVPWAEKA